MKSVKTEYKTMHLGLFCRQSTKDTQVEVGHEKVMNLIHRKSINDTSLCYFLMTNSINYLQIYKNVSLPL